VTALSSFALVTSSTSVNPAPAGVEIAGGRRRIEVGDLTYARCSYGGGGLLGDCAVGVNYSTDGGSSWQPLLPPGPLLAPAGIVLASTWVDVSAMQGDVLVAPFAYGATLLGLGVTLYAVTFAELQLR
jgi:hypothetical protein